MVIQSFRQAFIHGMQCATPVSVTCSDWVRACNFKMVGAICLKLLNCFFQKVDQNYTIDIKHIQQLNASHCFVSTFCTRYDTAYGPKVSKSPKEETRAVLVLGKFENGEWQVVVRCQQLNASHCFASTFCRSYETAYGAKNV
jgi:hypothetical protein